MNRRIVHLVSGKRYTGGAAVALSWHEALLGAGLDSVFAYQGGYHLEKRLQSEPFCVSYPATYRLPFFLREICRESVVLAHLPNDYWLTALFCGSAVAKVFAFHRPGAVRNDPLHRRIYAGIDGCIPAFPGMRLPAGPVALPWIPPAVDTRIFTPGSQPGSPPTLATIGKLTSDRKHERFLTLLHALDKLAIPFKGKIIGKGPHVSALRDLARNLNLSHIVEFSGYREDENLAEELRSVDILVWCSPGSQASHRAIPEAVLCGAVPAAFPMPGIEIWIRDAETGFLLPEDSTNAADILARALRHPEGIKQMRRAAYGEVSPRVSHSEVADLLSSTLASMVS